MRAELSNGYISTGVEYSRSWWFFGSVRLIVLAIFDMFIRICYYLTELTFWIDVLFIIICVEFDPFLTCSTI